MWINHSSGATLENFIFMNIAINGFGRIGRAAFKAILMKKSGLKVVAINDLTPPATLAHLLKHDTCYGLFDLPVTAGADELVVDGVHYPVTAMKDPAQLPWAKLKVDLVLECTGLFLDREKAGGHLQAGAKKVILSAPGKSDDIRTYVLGVNHEDIAKDDAIISNASCTTNCLAPVTAVIKENFGIKKAIMTTIHSYTADQNLIDGPHKDLRRARAAAMNIVPTSTGAAKAVAKTIPDLKDNFSGLAIRVPTPVVSLCDTVYLLKTRVDEEVVNKAIITAARSPRFKGIIETTDEPLVSSDLVGNPASTIVDLPLTKVVGGDLLKVISWYDNEWGYSNRLIEMAEYIGKKKLL